MVSAVYDTGNRGYRAMADNMVRSAQAVGYEVALKELKDDPMDSVNSAFDYRVNCFFKPHVILEALDESPEDLAWVDGDCLIRERFDEILDGCDAAFTLRRFKPGTLRDIYDGYINAGVMAFRNNLASRGFIKAWTGQLASSRADQDALNKVLLKHTLMEDYNEVVDVEGCRVKLVSCDKYNFFYFPESFSGAKILHVKGSLRPEFYKKCLEALWLSVS